MTNNAKITHDHGECECEYCPFNSTANKEQFNVVFYDVKQYSRQSFEDQNENGLTFKFMQMRLSEESAFLAQGAKAICIFVNDDASEPVVRILAKIGVEVIALRCAGYNNVDLDACREHGISVVRVPAYSPHAVAEHAVALIMTLNRKIHRAHNRVREGNFSLDGLVGFDMFKRTVGVIGTGKIGTAFAKILNGFGCRILAYDKYENDELKELANFQYVPLEELFAQSEIISLHAPLLPETKYMINEESIAAMKSGVLIINTSRGGLIDTRALIDGLKNRKVGGAGLDVYEEESDYFFEDYSGMIITDDILARLLTFNNVVVTSHQAFLTREALSNIAETTVGNLLEYRRGKHGEELSNSVL